MNNYAALYCHRPSDSARLLCERLGIRRRRAIHSLPGRLPRLLINWGCTSMPNWSDDVLTVLNPLSSVQIAVSKVKTYERLQAAGIPTLDFTTSRETALGWNANSSVLARRDGLSSGRGIRVYERGQLPGADGEQADFFTRYFPKTHEYRVHVAPVRRDEQLQGVRGGAAEGVQERGPRLPVPGQPLREQMGPRPQQPELQRESTPREALQQIRAIDIVQKKRTAANSSGDGGGIHRSLLERVVRSHDNGWVFAHENLFLPDNLRGLISDVSVRAVRALGLDFGAVDVLVKANNPDGSFTVKVAEVNTAPGLENTQTIDAYVKAFGDLVNQT